MKAIVLFAAFLLTITAKSQSLKEALYGGKLKADTGAVIRKGDTLKIKENMAQKVSDDSLKITQEIIADSIKREEIAVKREEFAVEKQKAIDEGRDTTAIVSAAVAAGIFSDAPTDSATSEAAIPKDNNKIWKSFIDELNTTIKSEVLTSGKVKNGTYSVLIDYEIKTDGQINIVNVASDPKSSFLEQQIKDRLTFNAPQLNPVLGTNGKPRTAAKKQMLTFVK